MRESELHIDNEVLKKGLRPYRMGIENQPMLEELFNLRCVGEGLVPAKKLGVFRELGDQWPVPKVLEGPSHQILASISDTNVLTLSHINSDLSLTTIQTISSISPVMSNLPELADFEQYIVVVGDFGILYGTPSTGYTYSSTALTEIPLARTCCNFRGQLVLGGVTSDWYDCDEEFVAWSRIGEVDCTPSKNNEAGFMPVKDVGKVLKVRTLGKQVLVCGEKGIEALIPTAQPAPTFGKQKILDVGIATRESIAGNELEYLFVGSDKKAYKISGEGLEVLGYHSFINQLEFSDIKVRFDPAEQDYYISDGERCFLFTGHGLSKVSQKVGEVVTIDGTSYGVLDDDEDPEWWSLITGPIDFQQRGMKMLMMVEGDVDDAFVTVWMKNKGGDFQSFKSVKMNSWNNATIMMTAQEFKVELEGELTDEVKPSYIKIRWKMMDFRGIRGQYDQ